MGLDAERATGEPRDRPPWWAWPLSFVASLVAGLVYLWLWDGDYGKAAFFFAVVMLSILNVRVSWR